MVLMLGVIFGGIALLAMGNLHGTLLGPLPPRPPSIWSPAWSGQAS